MRVVNRAVAVVRACEPYAAWANSIDARLPRFDVLRHRADPVVYLLPVVEIEADSETHLRRFWRSIFLEELAAWHEDEAVWPRRLSYAMFREWFDIEILSLVTDLCSWPLEVEER